MSLADGEGMTDDGSLFARENLPGLDRTPKRQA
jgi:hypothetical protein